MKVSNVGNMLIKPTISFKKFEHNQELFKKIPVFAYEDKPEEKFKKEKQWKIHN